MVLRNFLSLAVLVAVCAVAPGLPGGLPGSAVAQEGPGGLINPQRDCQSIVTCNYKRGGYFRGCISTYSCRVCRFVQARCSVGSKRGDCRRLRCSWGS